MKRSVLLSIFACFAACSLSAQAIEGLRIAWDRSSEVKIAQHGNYARVIRLDDNSFLAAFEHGGSACIAASADLVNWSSPRPIVSSHHGKSGGLDWHVHVANPELCLTREGTLLLAVNYRPSGQAHYPFSIVICRSEDGGVSWSSPDVLYCAGQDFSNGCWEPSFLQLPDGRIHLYFANEGPYVDSEEQEISVMMSDDDGRSWTSAQTVSFRKNHRDGMPVAAVLGREIVLAIEDNADGKFKPYTVRSSVDNAWAETIDGKSSFRKRALVDHVDRHVYMGAPYIVVLPSGESLLSYQTTEDRRDAWELSCMEVAVSDSGAMDFSKRTRPFDVPTGRSGKWNSLCVIDSNTVAAVSSTDKDGIVALYVVKGRLISPLVISEHSGSIDQIFVGSMSRDNLAVGVGCNKDGYVFEARVSDADMVPGDGVTFMIDITGKDNTSVQKGVFMVTVDRSGHITEVCEGKKGRWGRCTRSVAFSEAVDFNDGYAIRLKMKVGHHDGVRVSAAHCNATSNGEIYTEHLVHADPDMPSTWLRIAGQHF